ncbi:hypothetical protein FJT64_024430 [Amphibalanus amphitrite]|uniref:Uncharacterized protein n=1 Tax=Amphibalanus amphitrite TaxID=1232801 RepID=A0A6A4WNS3_AMPAM|nr:hypothetical protein FJT64_024430 [Amphibalanus amphitrite]
MDVTISDSVIDDSALDYEEDEEQESVSVNPADEDTLLGADDEEVWAPSCPDRADKENTERLQAAGAGSRRFYGDLADAGDSRFAASQQMRPPSSLCKSSEGGKSLQLIPIRPLDSDMDGKDPLYIGLPNNGNSYYQNATLQSLLGLRPFLSEMVSLISGPGEQRPVSHAARRRQTDGAAQRTTDNPA